MYDIQVLVRSNSITHFSVEVLSDTMAQLIVELQVASADLTLDNFLSPNSVSNNINA